MVARMEAFQHQPQPWVFTGTGASSSQQGMSSVHGQNAGDVSPCPDTSVRVLQQLVPPQPQPIVPCMENAQQHHAMLSVGAWMQGAVRADLSPRTFEDRL